MKTLSLGALLCLADSVGQMFARKPVEVRSEAFREALKPIKRRATPSGLGSTSKGHSWFPRRARWRPQEVPGSNPSRVVMTPAFGYEVDWHGTIRRTAAKVNKCSKRRARAACAA